MKKQTIKRKLERYEKEVKHHTRGGLSVGDIKEIVQLAQEEDGGSLATIIFIAWRAGYMVGKDREARKRRNAKKGAEA